MRVEFNIRRTSTGVHIVATGDYVDTIETTLVPRERIGRFVADLILDRVYLRGAQIIVNDATAFEAFDAEREYEAFVVLVDTV